MPRPDTPATAASSDHATHTEDSLRALRLPDLWRLHEEATGTFKRTPNKTYLVRTILKAQKDRRDEAPVSAPADADLWAGAVTVEARQRVLQRCTTVEQVVALRQTSQLQTTVAKDLDRQERLLRRSDELDGADDRATALAELQELRFKRRVIGRPGALRRVKDAIRALEAQLEEAAAQPADPPLSTNAPEGNAPEGDAAPSAPDAHPDDPWQGAVSIDDRVGLVRAVADTETLDELAAAAPAHPLQSRVVGELAKQRDALERVEATEHEAIRSAKATPDALTGPDEAARGALLALLGNRRTHARPGVVAALRARVKALSPDGEELPAEATTPLADLTVEQLQAAYKREVGRPTGSDDKGYLIWKVREVRKGRIAPGPTGRRRRDLGVKMKAVPLRLAEPTVEQLDEALTRAGFESRTAFIREALADKLSAMGEDAVSEALRSA